MGHKARLSHRAYNGRCWRRRTDRGYAPSETLNRTASEGRGKESGGGGCLGSAAERGRPQEDQVKPARKERNFPRCLEKLSHEDHAAGN